MGMAAFCTYRFKDMCSLSLRSGRRTASYGDRQEPAAYFLELWTRLELQMSPIYSIPHAKEQLSPFARNPCTRVRHDQEGNSGFSRPTVNPPPPDMCELDLPLMLRIPHFEFLEPWIP